jgi:hypothetical protein
VHAEFCSCSAEHVPLRTCSQEEHIAHRRVAESMKSRISKCTSHVIEAGVGFRFVWQLQAIECLDGRQLPDNMIREALGKLPTMEEIASVEAAVRNAAIMEGLAEEDVVQRLGPAEAYVRAVSRVQDVAERLRAMDFIASFTDAATAIQVLR